MFRASGSDLRLATVYVCGQASTSDQVTDSTNVEVDVTDSTTGTILSSRTDVSLNDGSVYTMFVAGTAASVSGTLRKDR